MVFIMDWDLLETFKLKGGGMKIVVKLDIEDADARAVAKEVAHSIGKKVKNIEEVSVQFVQDLVSRYFSVEYLDVDNFADYDEGGI